MTDEDTGISWVELETNGAIIGNTRTSCVFDRTTGGLTNCYGLPRIDLETRFPFAFDAPSAGYRFVMDVGAMLNNQTVIPAKAYELIDEILNAVLFVLIGLEILILTSTGKYALAAALAIPVVLLARFISVGIPMSLLRARQRFTPHAIKIMTWGGLRGGISVALALSLPAGPTRDLLLTMTYTVVIFSIVVQGLTIPYLLRRAVAEQPAEPEAASTPARPSSLLQTAGEVDDPWVDKLAANCWYMEGEMLRAEGRASDAAAAYGRAARIAPRSAVVL